jgi:pre-mRNA-splicing factor SYF1
VRGIYAHASQFCDPRTNPEFWAEWHSFEIDTGSDDTFREMLRIKHSVQARFNGVELPYRASAGSEPGRGEECRRGGRVGSYGRSRETTGGKAGLKFVSAKQPAPHDDDDEQAPSPQAVEDADKVHISDEGDI